MRGAVFLVGLLGLLAQACVGDGALPIAGGALPLELGEYRIQAGDEIDISFALNPELNVETVVRPDGRISLQLANDVDVEGRTPAELKEELRRLYSTELRDPEISVSVVGMAARIYVDGQIVKPGEYPWTREITALQAVALAGGLRETATKNEIVVLRRTEEGVPQVIQIDLEDAKHGRGKNRDVYLAPYDLVVVPESGVAQVNRWVDQYIRQNIPVRPRDVVPPDDGGGGGGGPAAPTTPPTP